jgi:leucyl-tRNA synthetase
MTERQEYNPPQIESKWQQRWAADRLYRVTEDNTREKCYVLTMFPYTSGDLHIGHWYAMAPADVYARFKRMQGYNVLHPIGFDAFGLPAENAAISRGIHPYTWTMKNIENMRLQLKSIGAIYDWDREVITCLPEYYKWTQWFFLKLYEAGLAYRGEAPVNWCPKCQTVLANEQVVGEGSCERCGTPVLRRSLEQWFFRITKYAEELMHHDHIDWPERIKLMQKNWIGKSQGAEMSFALQRDDLKIKEIKVFTTRPDTIYGVSFFVLAPEHPLVAKLTTPEQKAEVERYVLQAQKQSEIERTSTEKEKTGVFTGSYVINKFSGEPVPIWIADYVLLSYGTGAVMGVPSHDERDFAFAKRYGLPIKVVIAPPGWDGKDLEVAYTDVNNGTMANSGEFNGLPSDKGFTAICDYLEEQGWGRRTVTYRIRDWLISRQRYWGAPIPMIYCDKCGMVPVPEKDLPVLLPENAEFRPSGESPLKYVPSFVNTTCPKCGSTARRETDTMDTFMCSSWYFLRYTSPHQPDYPFNKENMKFWMPVDVYTGGAEHANMHLLYARFFIKAIRDCGIVDFDEPFIKLFNQGIIIYKGEKMSKSKGNVITPDIYVKELGADTVRSYIMFVGPWEQGGEWMDNGISGISRWLHRIWNYAQTEYVPKVVDAQAEKELSRILHRTIKKTSEDILRFRFNTMLAALMELTNHLGKVLESGTVSKGAWKNSLKTLLLLLAPSAPHLAEELWSGMGLPYSIHNQHWPEWDAELAREEEVTLVIQVNGKLRDKIEVPAGISEEDARELALKRDKIMPYLGTGQPARVIYVPGKLINIVVK